MRGFTVTAYRSTRRNGKRNNGLTAKSPPIKNRAGNMAGLFKLSAMQRPYWQQRRDQKNGIAQPVKKQDSEQPAEEKPAEKKGDFFARMIRKAPSKCMETGERLAGTMAINKAAVVCHILPKRKKGGVPSMATNELNIVFLHGDVHADMDNKGADYVTQMKIYPLMCKRVALMWPHIPEVQRKNVPAYFLPSNLLKI